MSMNKSRPTRIKRQPAYAKDHMELNSGEIQKVQKCATKMPKSQIYPSYSKLLLSFVNRVNESYRSQILNLETEKHQKFHQNFQKNVASEKPSISDQNYSKNINKSLVSHLERKNQSKALAEKKLEKTKSIRKQKKAEKDQFNSPNSVSSSTKTIQVRSAPQARYKTFKRSSYHIGIAFSIYLQQIKSKISEVKDHHVIDPTYMAHKLKMESMQAI